MNFITIKTGWVKAGNQVIDVSGTTFRALGEYTPTKDGGYIQVQGYTAEPRNVDLPRHSIRVKVSSIDDIVINALERSETEESTETDEEIITRLRNRFDILQDMTRAVKNGHVKAMIVTGPPGVGKSFGIEEVLSKDNLFNMLADRAPKYAVVKGATSAIGLYAKLFEYSSEKSILVFDDSDMIFFDDLSLNLLKACLDTSKKRMVHWNTDSRLLRQEDIPSSFEFKGGIIFITNIAFDNIRSKTLQDHLKALESRCHFIDLKMNTAREKLLRIKQITADGMLKDYHFSTDEEQEIVDFIMDNQDKLRELSLRTVLKAADLKKSFPTKWQKMAEVTLMKDA